MSISRGLKNIKESMQNSGGPKTVWLTSKFPDGATWKVRFLDDLDESTQTHNGAGTAISIKEHQAGQNYMLKAQCSKEEDGSGVCWACEQAIKHPKTGWARKQRAYANVLVNNGVDDPFVAVWSIPTGRSPLWDFLVDVFVEDGSISDREFRVKRSGEGTATSWLMRDLGVDKEQFDFAPYERFDLESLVREVPYEDQPAYYSKGNAAEEEPETEDSPESTEW